ncbi:MAG: translocation/assembly module TamB [Desulfobacterales bacterium]|nr:translocation/assembly module TamB [Desulfobacterales bacterium]
MKESGPEKPKQKHWGKKRIRFFLRLLIYPLVVLIILLLGAFLFLQTETARNAVKTYIEEAATQYLKADLQVEKISGSLLFDISLEGVRFSKNNVPVLTARRVSASYLLSLLLTRVLMLNEVEIDGMALNLIREKDGRLNITTLIPADETHDNSAPAPLALTTLVSRVAVFDTEVILTDKQTEASQRRVSNIRLAAGLKLSTDGVVTARIINLALTLDQPAFSLAGLSGRVSYSPGKSRLEIKDLRGRTRESDVIANGSIDLEPAGIQFNLRSSIKTLSLPEMGRLLSIPTLDRGRLAGTLQAKGNPNRFYHEAQLDLEGMSLSSSGQIEWTGSESLGMEVSASIRHLNPAALPLVDLQGISGDINSDIRLQGSDLVGPGRRGRLTVDLKPSRIAGYNLTAARIEAAFDPGAFVLTDSFLAGPQGRITVRRAVADIFDSARPGRLSLVASAQDLDPAVSGRADLTGTLNLNVTATAVLPVSTGNRFDLAAVTAEVSADIGPSRIQAVDIGSGRIKAAWNGRDIEIETLELSGAGASVAVSGSLTPGVRSSRLMFRTELADLQQIARLVPKLFPDRFPSGGDFNLKGQLKINGEFNGWWDRPDFSVSLSGSGFKYDQFSAKDFALKGTFKGPPDGFKATAASQAQNLTVNGIRIPRLDLALQIGPDSAQVDLSLQHEKNLSLAVKGRFDEWRQATKKITISTFRLTPTKTGRAPAAPSFDEITNRGPIRLTLMPNALDIAALNLISEEAALSLTGRLMDGNRINATLSLTRLDLKRIPRIIEVQDKFSGTFSADMELTGTLSRPLLKARLGVKDFSGFDISFSDLDVSLDYRSPRAAFKATGYSNQNMILDLNGEAGVLCSLRPFKLEPQTGGFKMAVVARDLKLSTLPIPKPAEFDFDGTLRLDARLHGDLTDPKFSGNLAIKDGFFALKGKTSSTVSFSDFNLTFGFDGSRATVQAAVFRQVQQVLDLTAEAPCRISLYPFKLIPPERDLRVSLRARDLKLSELPLPRKTAFNYEGLLSLDLDMAGDLSTPEIKGKLSLQEGFIAPENKDPRDYGFSSLNIAFHYEAANVDLNAALYRGKQKFLDLNGRAGLELSLVPFRFKPLDNDFRLEAAARNLKLSMLPIPRPAGIDFDALLNVNATASGNLTKPVIRGSLSLQDGYLTLLNPALSYETVRAQVDFSPAGVVINAFSLTGDTEGTLNISGRIKAEGLKPTGFDIRLTGENLYIPYQKAVTARVRPDLKLIGTPHKPVLGGILTITESRVNLDLLSTQGPAEIQIESAGADKKTTIEIPEEPGSAEALLRPLAADVLVSVPKNAWLKGQGVTAEMAGQVNLKKEADKPFVLVGSLNAVRGTFDFQNKLFKISRGNVDFIGLAEPNPNLDIQAETRIAKVNIIIKITGTAQQMTLDLDSEPAMDRTDIISYLVFGKPAGDLNQQQNLNAEQAALNLTGQLAANELKNLLGDAFSLDVLTLESGGGDITQGSLAVGKYVTPEVFVLYRHRFKVDEPDQVEVTYEINRNFSIETQLGDEKTSGIDFVWDFDF